jgi:HEAT repeat protein
VRELSAVAIGQIGTASAHAALDQALDSPHPEVRFQALAGYVEAEGDKRPERVLAMLDDPDREVRGQAARALAELGKQAVGERGLARLREALIDGAASVRSEAALALSRLGDASGRGTLASALDQPAFRAEALEAAARLRLTELREPIARLASGWLVPPADRVMAMKALAQLGDERGALLLRHALGAFRARLRALAADAVAELGMTELCPELSRLARRGGLSAGAAVDALARLAPSSAAAKSALEALCDQRGTVGELSRAARAARKGPEIPAG